MSDDLSSQAPPVDIADERDTSLIRDALESSDAGHASSKPFDLAVLKKNPAAFKKACRAGIPMPQRKAAWEALLEMNTPRQYDRSGWLAATPGGMWFSNLLALQNAGTMQQPSGKANVGC
jgi:hypothetical protein